MITFKELFEAKDAGGHGSEKHHVTAFTRMNPPTTGHMQVINKLHAVSKEHGADHSLVVSHSNDAKKNPLTPEQKIKHLGRYSPETKVSSSSKESPTILHHAASLHKSGVQHLHVVAGSDRHEQLHKLLHQYNGKEAGHGHYHFKSITMHSSGDRDPDSEGTEGMSGTKMRQHAHENNFKEFRKGVPSHVSDKHAHELMHDVRKGSGIKEEAISYKTFMEARMSAAVKLQRAFEREQAKSAASRERAKELLAPKKPEPVKEEAIDETIVKVDSGYEVHSETGKNLGGSPTLTGAKKRLKQVEYFKHMKEEDMQFTESVHNNRTGFAKRKREDDEYHNGGDLDRHTYKYTVSKPGVNDGKKHERHVTTPLTSRKKHEIEHLARAHLTKQGYEIHEEVVVEGEDRGPYKQKSPVVIAPKDPKAKTYGKIVSKLRPVAEEVIDESMADSWKSVQSMDKGSVTGGKEQVKKHLAYLTAVHAHHKKFGNDTLKVRKKIEGIKRSRIAEESDAYARSEENKKSAEAAHKQGDMFAHHLHMADHHDNLSQWHSEKGRHSEADRHAEKAEQHHEKAMSLKEETIEEATPYYNKPSFLKKMGRAAKQERLAREKKEAEAKKPVKEETMEEAATGAKPGWMLRKDPELAKKIKDQLARKKHVLGEPTKKEVKEETQENTMGLKSFITLVKEGTLQSSGDDSIPTLTSTPAKEKKKAEEECIDEALDPSEIAGNPRMYSADSAKKAYYHKKATASDKESLAKHLDRHHGNKNWRKPVKEEAEQIDEKLTDAQKEAVRSLNHAKGGAPTTSGTKKAIKFVKQNEEVEQIDEKSEQARKNKTMKNMMDASRGARFKLNNPVPDAGPEHKTGQAHNKAIGRALRKEDVELEEAKIAAMTPPAPVKPTAPKNKKPAVESDLVNAAGDKPHEEKFETVRKEGYTFSDLVQALKEGLWPGTPEHTAKYGNQAKQGGGSGIKKGHRYGGSLQKDEPEHDDDAKAGRPTGAKSGARKNLGNSKLHK